MPRFVILNHTFPAGDSRPVHWDWMFESGESLETWSTPPVTELLNLLTQPAKGSDKKSIDDLIDVECKRLKNHRLIYLDYSGPISANRGEVSQIASGYYERFDEKSNKFRLAITSPPTSIDVQFPEQDGMMKLRIAANFC